MVTIVKSYNNGPKFSIGDRVEKVSGYKFPGTVVAVFRTLRLEWRYVVEATGEDYQGMLHIFNGDQLELI